MENLRRYDVDPCKLLVWLGQPKRGIDRAIALRVLAQVDKELGDGKEYFRDSLYYPEDMRRLMTVVSTIPDHFWIDNYVLELCDWAQEEIFEHAGGFKDELNLLKALGEIAHCIKNIDKRIGKFEKIIEGFSFKE